ncbi:MAG: fibronectin type III domain-containing protein [Chitinispirillaceae bacterium]|nr:fibronectin type III domain-containing protein [Chitinispirillaceae bacterium]
MNGRLLFALSMAALLPACILDPNADGSGSTTETARVVGKLYQPDGKTPAAGVRVAIRSRNTLADTSGFGLPKRMADTATVTTDDSGKFSFDSTLDTGLYVIEADDGDNNVALIDSVKVGDSDSSVQVEDTLRPAGAITGIVYLSEGGDPRKVFIMAMGLDRFTRPDGTGRFTFGNLAEAVYDLTLISSLDDYTVLEVPGVEVVSGGTRELDTLRLPFTGIPTVKGLKIEYDTMKQIVKLMWVRADTGLVSGYHIYRRNVNSNTVFSKVNTSLVTDTVYVDSSVSNDFNYEYRLKVVDKNANEGDFSTVVYVGIESRFHPIDSIPFNGSGWARVAVTDSGDLFVVENGSIQLYDRKSKTAIVVWTMRGAFGTVQQMRVLDDSTLIIASSTQIGRLSLKDSTVSVLTTDTGITGMALKKDVVYYIAGNENPNARLCTFSLSAGTKQTLITIADNFSALTSNETYIQGLAVSNSALVFGVSFFDLSSGSDSIRIITSNHDGSNIKVIATLPGYTNQGPAFCFTGDSIFVSTHAPVSNSVVTRIRIINKDGMLLTSWENRNGSYDLVKIVGNKLYAATVGIILVYSQ